MDPWVLGVVIFVTLPIWIVIFCVFGGPLVIAIGIDYGGPVGAILVFVGFVWFLIVVFLGSQRPPATH